MNILGSYFMAESLSLIPQIEVTELKVIGFDWPNRAVAIPEPITLARRRPYPTFKLNSGSTRIESGRGRDAQTKSGLLQEEWE